jgi:hypothetical protein
VTPLRGRNDAERFKALRVLAEIGKLPLITVARKLPHLTEMCAVSAAEMPIKMLQFGRHITSEQRAARKLEDTSPRIRNASVADGRRISPFPCRFQAIEDRGGRVALR